MRQMSNCRFFCEAKFRRQKMDEKKTNWVSCLQKKYKKLRTMPSQYQRKDHKVRNGSIQQYGCKISNMNNEILPIHEDYVTTTIFT